MLKIIKRKKVKALGLCSGGLDSILSAIVLLSQGIEVYLISFETLFFLSDKARFIARKNNIPIYIVNISKKYFEMLNSCSCKYGKNINPCMDCHSLMLRVAGQFVIRFDFDFLFTGEVLGQRPMSQNKFSLRYVQKHSGFDGHILRPLSAKRLPKTIIESKKKVIRRMLLNISGRSRSIQIDLANKFGIKNISSPAGGCLLTDKNFSTKFMDFLKYQLFYPLKEFSLSLCFLKIGRHFRLDKKLKLIVSHDKEENKELKKYVNLKYEIILKTFNFPGPISLLQGCFILKQRILSVLAASICLRYNKGKIKKKWTKSFKISLFSQKNIYKYILIQDVNFYDPEYFIIK